MLLKKATRKEGDMVKGQPEGLEQPLAKKSVGHIRLQKRSKKNQIISR